MTTINNTVYDTVNPHQRVAEFVHEAWETRDQEVWAHHIQDLITPDAVVLDAGCGLGRLLPRLWPASKIVMVEPDLKRFLHASLVAKGLTNDDQQLLQQLQDDDFIQTDQYQDLLKDIYASPIKNEKVVLLNDVMQSPAIAPHGKFDLIICSHIFEHVSLNVVQESIAAFYNFLKPQGTLIIFACKSPVLYHFRDAKEFNHQHILISREEYATICQHGHGLGIRYIPFDLFQTILNDPFNLALRETFGNEFQPQSTSYELPSQPLFMVKQWEAYHSEFYTHKAMAVGTYIEYPQIQARLYRPIQPITSAAEILELEHQVNQNETLKKLYLIDMVVVAQKVI